MLSCIFTEMSYIGLITSFYACKYYYVNKCVLYKYLRNDCQR